LFASEAYRLYRRLLQKLNALTEDLILDVKVLSLDDNPKPKVISSWIVSEPKLLLSTNSSSILAALNSTAASTTTIVNKFGVV
jgi:hypothetical protein